MENYVVSLEIAKKMKEAGWKKTTKFWHNDQGMGHRHIGGYRPDMSECPAPLTDEILEELPDYISEEGYFQLVILKFPNNFSIKYQMGLGIGKKESLAYEEANTLPNALGLMWLYLKQNNQLTKR